MDAHVKLGGNGILAGGKGWVGKIRFFAIVGVYESVLQPISYTRQEKENIYKTVKVTYACGTRLLEFLSWHAQRKKGYWFYQEGAICTHGDPSVARLD